MADESPMNDAMAPAAPSGAPAPVAPKTLLAEGRQELETRARELALQVTSS